MIKRCILIFLSILSLELNVNAMDWRQVIPKELPAPPPPSMLIGPSSTGETCQEGYQPAMMFGFSEWTQRHSSHSTLPCPVRTLDILNIALDTFMAQQHSYVQEQIRIFEYKINSITLLPLLQGYKQELADYIVEFERYQKKLNWQKTCFFTSKNIHPSWQEMINGWHSKEDIHHFVNHSKFTWSDFVFLKRNDLEVAQAESYLQYLQGCRQVLDARIQEVQAQQASAIQEASQVPESPSQANHPKPQTHPTTPTSQEVQQKHNIQPTLPITYKQQLEHTRQCLLALPAEQRQLITTKQLLDSIERTLKEQGIAYDMHFTFTSEAKVALAENNIAVDKFEHIIGNAFQLQVAEHSVENINKAAALRIQCSSEDIMVFNACDAAINFADAALDMVLTPAHPDIAIMLNDASDASYTIGEFLKDVGQFGFQWADNTRRILQGEVIGTCKAVIHNVEGISQLIAHPQETIQKLDQALYHLDRFLGKLIGGDPATVQQTKKLCQAFMNLPLEKQSEFVTEFLMSFYIPGKVGSMISSLVQHPSVARGLTSLGKLAAEELRILEFAIDAQLRFHIESTELVNFGGRIMSRPLMDHIVRWGKANQLLISDIELVERAEAFLPLTRACTKAAHEFIIGENAFSRLQQSNIKQLLDQGKKIGDRIETMIGENTKIMFRKDFGKNAHTIRSHGYNTPVDHYNIDIQVKDLRGWEVVRKFHIVVGENGTVKDFW